MEDNQSKHDKDYNLRKKKEECVTVIEREFYMKVRRINT